MSFDLVSLLAQKCSLDLLKEFLWLEVCKVLLSGLLSS